MLHLYYYNYCNINCVLQLIASRKCTNTNIVFACQGVDCCDYNKNLNVLVTGGSDHLVRLWNPYVTSRPIAILQGHSMSIVDVKIHEALGQLLSYSRDTVCTVSSCYIKMLNE